MAVGAVHGSAATPGEISPWTQIKLLFGLKARLTFRGFQRSRSAVAGLIIAILFFLPLSIGMGVGTGLLFLMMPLSPQTVSDILRAIFLGIGLIWVTGPLFGFQLNDSYDITRLFVFPVSLKRLFIGGIAGSLLDTPTLLLFPALLGTLIAFACKGFLSAIVAILVLPLFLFQTFALSQAIILATAGILRSRKWRDFAIVAVPLITALTQYFRMQLTSDHTLWQHLMHSPMWLAAGFLPPGCAAQALVNASHGEIMPAAGYLLALGVYTAATIYLATYLLEKVYQGDDVRVFRNTGASTTATAPRAISRPSDAPSAPKTSVVRASDTPSGFLPSAVFAMAIKELRYYTRDPYFRLVLARSFGMLLIWAFTAFGNPNAGHGGHHRQILMPDTIRIWGLTGLLLLQHTVLAYNQFGSDGAAAPMLFGFPASRRQIVIGKNLPLFVALAAVDITIGIVTTVITGSLGTLPVLILWQLLALGILISIGNVLSVCFPYKTVIRGMGGQRMAGMGAATGFVYFGVNILALVFFAPVLGAILVPYLGWFGTARSWLAVTIPASLIYTAVMYGLSLMFAERLLIDREPEIMAKVYRAPE